MRKLHIKTLPKFSALLRRNFFSGVLVVVPIGVIAWILLAGLRTLWDLKDVLPESWQPEHWIPDPTLATFISGILTLAVLIVLAIAISFVGWLSKQVLGQKILDIVADGIIQKIPVVRSIYSGLDQLMRAMATSGSGQFNRVVYVEWPRKGLWAIAFVTGGAKTKSLPSGMVNIFIPATPNPTSGFHMLVSEDEIKDAHMSVEEAFKTILSLGLAQSSLPHGR